MPRGLGSSSPRPLAAGGEFCPAQTADFGTGDVVPTGESLGWVLAFPCPKEVDEAGLKLSAIAIGAPGLAKEMLCEQKGSYC